MAAKSPRISIPCIGAVHGARRILSVTVTSAGLALCTTPMLAQTYVVGAYESGSDNIAPDLSLDRRFEQRQLAVGAQIGAFWFAPDLQLDEALNDNIYATPNGGRADAVTTLTARTSLNYAKGTSTLGVQGWLAGHVYAVHSTEDSWEGSVQANFTSLVNDDLQLLANGGFKRLVDPRTDPSGLQGLTPTTYEVYDGAVGASVGHAQSNLLDFRVGASRTTYDPLQGSQGPIITNDRNYTEIFGEADFRHTIAPGRGLYVKLRPTSRDFDLKFDQSGFQHSSTGVRADIGADWDIDSVLFLNVETGYQRQGYDDPRFGTVGEPDGRIKLSWWPTLLTNVTLSGAHEYYEAFFNPSPGNPSPGAVRNKAILRVEHELRRQWLASVTVSVERDDVMHVPTHYTSETADLSLRYQFADGVSAGADYIFTRQTSTGTTVTTGTSSFQQNIVTFTFRKLF